MWWARRFVHSRPNLEGTREGSHGRCRGYLDVTTGAQPPFTERDRSELNPDVVCWELSGAVIGTPDAHMVNACIGTEGSADCVAIEHFTGMDGGNPGTFVLRHSGHMRKGPPEHSVTIFPYSDTGEPTDISDTLEINSSEGKRSCALPCKEP